MERSIVADSLMSVSFWGKVTFLVGFVVNFIIGIYPLGWRDVSTLKPRIHIQYLCPSYVNAVRTASLMWMIGCGAFIKDLIEAEYVNFQTKENVIKLLQIAVFKDCSNGEESILDKLDTDGDGIIQADELRIFFEKHDVVMSSNQLNQILADADFDSNTSVSITEFINYLKERKFDDQHPNRYVVLSVLRSYGFWCFVIWIVGCVCFVVSTYISNVDSHLKMPVPSKTARRAVYHTYTHTLNGIGVACFVIGYSGYINISMETFRTKFQMISDAKAALRKWAADGGAADLARLADVDGDGHIGQHELRALVSHLINTDEDALLHIHNELWTLFRHADNSTIDVSELITYSKELHGPSLVETEQYVISRAIHSPAIIALICANLSSFFSLMQMYVWRPVGIISSLCATLSLIGGVVPFINHFRTVRCSFCGNIGAGRGCYRIPRLLLA
jgi:Ca2+-binding EF-hand superfamily protein